MPDLWVEDCSDAVIEHARNVIRYAQDPLQQGVPLFCDGLSTDRLAPATWESDGQTWVLSNLASQQQLLRLLDGITAITGMSEFAEAAHACVAYALQSCRVGELLSWGGHMAWDLSAGTPVFASNKGPVHELKRSYPYYSLMYRVNRSVTNRFIETFWDRHMIDWSRLEFNRHGDTGAKARAAEVWNRDYLDAPVFFEGVGLTFCNAGSDLYYSAAQLTLLSGEQQPLVWANRLLERYAATRHPETGLGGYQFSVSTLPPGSDNVPRGRDDRAREQLSGQLARWEPTEPTVVSANQLKTMLGPVAICRLQLAEELGPNGARFLAEAVRDLQEWAHHAYDPESDHWHPMLTCGVRLSSIVLERDGYYGRAGQSMPTAKSDGQILLAYALAFRLTGDDAIWRQLQNLFTSLRLGELGRASTARVTLNLRTGSRDPFVILASIELHRAMVDGQFLRLACRVAENQLSTQRNHGFFMGRARSQFFRVDRIEPLVLLHLVEELSGCRGRVPTCRPGQARFEAWHDCAGETTDEKWLYRGGDAQR